MEGQPGDLGRRGVGRDVPSFLCHLHRSSSYLPLSCSGFLQLRWGFGVQRWCGKETGGEKARYCQRNQDQRETTWSGHPESWTRAGSWPSSWCLRLLSQLMWNCHCVSLQIYLHTLIFPFCVSTETFPWHLAFTSRELWLPCRSEPGEERWWKSILAWCRVWSPSVWRVLTVW